MESSSRPEVKDPRRIPEELSPLLDRLLDASSSGIVVTDPNGPDRPIVYVNEAFERITGYPAEEVVGYNCRFLQGPDRDQPELDGMRTAIRDGRDYQTILKNHRKDGTPFWNELYISPVRDEEGRLTHFIGVQNDVTERQSFEGSLQEREERLKLAMSSGRVGMCEWNAQTNELTCSEEFAEIFGLPAGRLNPSREELVERVHPEDHEALMNEREAAARTEDSHEAEYRVVHPDGEVRWVTEKGRIYRDPEGNLEKTIGIIQDITARKEAEQERNSLLEREREARELAERATRRMFMLEQASTILSDSLDYEKTLARITDVFLPNLADWCLVDVVGEDGAVSRETQSHIDPHREHLLKEAENQGLTSITVPEVPEVLASGRPCTESGVSSDLLAGLSEGGDDEETLEELSYMVVPLAARGRILGAVTLGTSGPGRSYDNEDLSLANELANRCGLALENARLYREQRLMARTLQRGLLLQDIPGIPGMEIGLEYLSAGQESEVGGDFYDLIDTHYDGWLCLLGDVSGKGVRAATSTALILYALRAVAFRGDRPSMVLSALNGAMMRQESDNQFCTAICARLEPGECKGDDVKLTLARGGHPPPLLLREDGSLEELGEPGRAIGVFEDLELEDLILRLKPGNTLVLYTDGVTEARSPDGAFFGEERLAELVQSCTGMRASAISESIKNAVLEHRNGSPGDDVAILVLRVSKS